MIFPKVLSKVLNKITCHFETWQFPNFENSNTNTFRLRFFFGRRRVGNGGSLYRSPFYPRIEICAHRCPVRETAVRFPLPKWCQIVGNKPAFQVSLCFGEVGPRPGAEGAQDRFVEMWGPNHFPAGSFAGLTNQCSTRREDWHGFGHLCLYCNPCLCFDG